jgi:dTDP-L-rhamnose 4-epimerase
MKFKFLITGGAGFIGSYLSKLLYKNGHEIHIIDNFNPQIHGVNKEKSYLYHEVKTIAKIYHEDILRSKSLDSLLVECDFLIHLASETGTGQSMYDIEKYVKTNSVGTAVILEKLLKKKNNIKKFILASSRSIYGEGEYVCEKHGVVYPSSRKIKDMKKGDFECKCPVCMESVNPNATNENCNISPLSIYAVTKYNQEQLVSTTCESINLPYTIFRFQNVYGKGQSINNPYTGILSIFSKLILEGKKIDVFEDGMESRDFVHVSDVVSAIFMDIFNNINNQTYNVGTGNKTTVIQIVDILKSIFNNEVNSEITGTFRIGDIRHNYADINKISKKLNFKPIVELKEGIAELVNWIKESKETDSTVSFEDSIKEMESHNLLIRK